MTVIIGIDPHKASHTAVAIVRDEQQLAEMGRLGQGLGERGVGTTASLSPVA
jgi:hypothetical protein